ncbi:hypothetical protein KOL96_00905 (plasmid) [Ralstonia wenshanensis]|jgi:hypothetical protein|uniref:hypothetical protein n=1 Tax=Ralstonia TaxID=48736 RepID=UPI001E5FD5F9|nr:hypothetical protein [Ralstonia wenshanensis]UGS88841.1 hypothetical protein KOL96_00905 [Ralstonia wenshanensis]
MKPARALKRYALPSVAALTVAIGLVGAMHLKAARPLLAMLGVPCPVDSTTAAQVSALRASGLAQLRASQPAPARPLPGGFVLDGTTTTEAVRWAHENGVACDAVTHGYNYLRCRGVDARKLGLAGPPVSELWLSFGPSGRLVGVDIYRRGMNASDTTTAWNGATHALRDALGTPTATMGDASPQVLSQSPLQTARLQYRFSDYLAIVTASNLPYAGLAVREQYMSSRI